MREIFVFLKKYHFTVIFLLLEGIAFYLLFRNNEYQSHIYETEATSIYSYIYKKTYNLNSYFRLKENNKILLEENEVLKNKLLYFEKNSMDSILPRNEIHYSYVRAGNVNISYNLNKNIMTIDKGYSSGVMPEMGVTSYAGVVGVVKDVSKNFAIVIPLININLRLSAKIKRNNYYGSLQWDGKDYRYTYLYDIPYHLEVFKGDTIITSGLSSIFPTEEPIGVVSDVTYSSQNFVTIRIKMFVDFRKINNVYVLKNALKDEQKQLEIKNAK